MEIFTTIVVFLLIFLVFMLNLAYIHVSNTKYLVAAIFFSAFFSFPNYSEAKVVTDLQANLCRSAHTLSVICLRLFLNYQPPRMHELHTFRANEAGLRGCTHFPPVPSALSDQNERSGWKEINVQALIHWGTYPIGWLTGTKLVSGRLLENIYSVVRSEESKGQKRPNKQCHRCHERADSERCAVRLQRYFSNIRILLQFLFIFYIIWLDVYSYYSIRS